MPPSRPLLVRVDLSLLRNTASTLLLAAALGAQWACGGGSSGSPSGGTPVATPMPATSSSNPCTAALAASPGVTAARSTSASKLGALGYDVRDPRDFLALHQLPREGGLGARATTRVAARSGDIAVLNDDGSLIVGANGFDLGGVALRFDPNGHGGYDVQRTSGGFRPDLGRRLRLTDDATSQETLGFAFPFYGTARGSAFVNSDGNLTFGSGDVATDDRSLGRVLSGAPRVAPFFADLDPGTGGGVFVSSAPDAFTVTWCAVPDFDDTGKVTAQASLLPSGAVEIRLDSSTTLRDGVVALSPGATTAFASVDLSAASAPAAGGGGAVGERFAAQASLDLVGAAHRFYTEFGDSYDQLVVWTDVRVTDSGTFAFESTIKNGITGIGQEIVDLAAPYGSAGQLASVVLMDNLGKYPADPAQRVNGENSTLALVAHETGHRWGATLRFRDASGASSDAWLGRQLAHWSFFTNSDASVLEGNEIEDRGGGSFRTTATVLRYSPFDLYAMGLLADSEVPTTFYVENPVITDPTTQSFNRESAPRTGVSMTGTPHEVTISAVVAAMGPRNPPASAAPRVHRQAWLYVVSAGHTADPAAITKLDAIRQAFEGFFSSATGGRMSVETQLD
jgi:hypothetical protein